MKTLAAKKAKTSFDLLLDTAQREPVAITRNGRAVAVVLSIAEFERYQGLENAWWAARAGAAARRGFVGPDASEKLIRDLVNASN
ncbi:MAG: type II toxin-antitoxin system Phd/YefM family antitoxin [Alphaproteobacteria bacterium]|nr:type II toxin-antitoxin system Phd/YefM family antitoxin [Alphaproteobacteria bacterium]